MQGRTAVIVVAAGSGSRAGGDVPKQYRAVAGRSVLQRTIDTCLACAEVDLCLCVIGGGHEDLYARRVSTAPNLLSPVIGGATRQASVLTGLRSLAGQGIETVLIHDAARPFVSAKTIERIIDAVEPGTGAMPALPVSDTLVFADSDVAVRDVDRAGLWRAQTPQGFVFDDILHAHEAAKDGFTDDASLARAAGLAVRLVPGERANEKITTAEDLSMAQIAFAPACPDVRVGHGYDTHRLVAGDHVWLCGVRLPHAFALDGHSDADVGLHALTDALLATVGAGDIGDHFPPTDPQWRGSSSDTFLRRAVELVLAGEGRITHADVTLVCEAPKIGPHRAAMRQTIAALLGIAVGRVSVKATTNEERGFVGRNEGIVALATATVVFPGETRNGE